MKTAVFVVAFIALFAVYSQASLSELIPRTRFLSACRAFGLHSPSGSSFSLDSHKSTADPYLKCRRCSKNLSTQKLGCEPFVSFKDETICDSCGNHPVWFSPAEIQYESFDALETIECRIEDEDFGSDDNMGIFRLSVYKYNYMKEAMEKDSGDTRCRECPHPENDRYVPIPVRYSYDEKIRKHNNYYVDAGSSMEANAYICVRLSSHIRSSAIQPVRGDTHGPVIRSTTTDMSASEIFEPSFKKGTEEKKPLKSGLGPTYE